MTTARTTTQIFRTRGKEDQAGATGYRYVRVDFSRGFFWLGVPGVKREKFSSLEEALCRRREITGVDNFPLKDEVGEYVILDLDYDNDDISFDGCEVEPPDTNYPIKYKRPSGRNHLQSQSALAFKSSLGPPKKRIRVEDEDMDDAMQSGDIEPTDKYIWDGRFKPQEAEDLIIINGIPQPLLTDLWSMVYQKHFLNGESIAMVEKWRTIQILSKMQPSSMNYFLQSFFQYTSTYQSRELGAIIRQLIDVSLLHPTSIEDSIWWAHVIARVSPVSQEDIDVPCVLYPIIDYCYSIRVNLHPSVIEQYYQTMIQVSSALREPVSTQ